jgi:hypothetical protein
MQFFNCKSNLCWSYNSYITGNLFVQYSKLAIIIVYLACAMMYIEHDLEFDCKVFVKILVGRTSCAPSLWTVPRGSSAARRSSIPWPLVVKYFWSFCLLDATINGLNSNMCTPTFHQRSQYSNVHSFCYSHFHFLGNMGASITASQHIAVCFTISHLR